MKKVKRKYASTHREILAVRTRDQIIESARRLFRENGVDSTTIEQIAKDAGVAPPTVYATFGGKRAILVRLLDDLEKAADASSLAELFGAPPGAERKQLDAFIAFCVRFFTQGADLMQIVELSGMGNADIAEFTRVGKERALQSCRQLLSGWQKRGVLRNGLSEETAADVLWAISNTELYSLFVRGRKWPPEKYQAWLSEMAARELLRPDPAMAHRAKGSRDKD